MNERQKIEIFFFEQCAKKIIQIRSFQFSYKLICVSFSTKIKIAFVLKMSNSIRINIVMTEGNISFPFYLFSH